MDDYVIAMRLFVSLNKEMHQQILDPSTYRPDAKNLVQSANEKPLRICVNILQIYVFIAQ